MTQPPQQQPLMDKHQLADRLRVSVSLVEKRCAARTWPFHRVARSYRFTETDVAAILALVAEKPAPRATRAVGVRSAPESQGGGKKLRPRGRRLRIAT